MLEFVLNFFIEILFPPVCGVCGKLNKDWICDKCYESLNKLKLSKKEYYNEIIKNKDDYKSIKSDKTLKIFYDELLYIFSYKGVIRRLILKYKFENKAYISNLFAEIILRDDKILDILKEYDLLVLVPMFKKKKKQRGYNQTELIINKFYKRINLNLYLDLNLKINNYNLIKVKNTKMQSTLSGLERKENIKNAFLVNNKEEIKNKRIIIFDDIFTTGETVNEISRILKEAGAKEILVFVIAKD